MEVLKRGQVVLVLSPPERDALRVALEDVVTRYEASNEHDSEHYAPIRTLLEALDESV